MRFAGDLLQKLHGLGAAAIIAPVARGRQFRWGQQMYDSIPSLWQDAVRWTIDAGEPLTPANIRRNAERVIDSQNAMASEELGLKFDMLGIPLDMEDQFTPASAEQAARVAAREAAASREAARYAATIDLDDPDLPF